MALLITGFFDDDEAARKAVRDLEAASIPFGNISITSGKAVERWSSSLLATAQGGAGVAGAGAAIGGMIGGATGLLAGLGTLTLSQLSPAGLAGWLTMAGVLAGAAGGGIVGALVGSGLNRKQARPYARGGTLVAVRADETCALKVQRVLQQGGAARLQEREAEYVEEGWERFDEEAPLVKSNDPASGRIRYVD